MRKLSVFIAGILCSFFLTACSNFLDGSDLKNQIDNEVVAASKKSYAVYSASPAFEEAGFCRDSMITIIFKEKVNPDFFRDFSFISITDELGIDLSSHYLNPEISEDGFSVRIRPDHDNLIDFSNRVYKNISVSLSDKICAESGAVLKGGYYWTFKLNSQVDTVKPVFSDVKLTNNSWSDEIYEIAQVSLLKNDELSVPSEDFFTSTYRTNSLHINLSGYDSDTEVYEFTVREKLLFAENGDNRISENLNVEKTFSTSESGVVLAEKKVSVDLDYDFSPEVPDGIIQLSLVISDRSGNESEKSYLVIKDTKPYVMQSASFGKEACDKTETPVESEQEAQHYFYLEETPEVVYATWNGIAYKTDISDTKIYVSLYTKAGELLSSGDEVSGKPGLYYFEMIDNTTDCKIVVEYMDSLKNRLNREYKVLAAPKVVKVIYRGRYFSVAVDVSENPYEIIAGNKPFDSIASNIIELSGDIKNDADGEYYDFYTKAFSDGSFGFVSDSVKGYKKAYLYHSEMLPTDGVYAGFEYVNSSKCYLVVNIPGELDYDFFVMNFSDRYKDICSYQFFTTEHENKFLIPLQDLRDTYENYWGEFQLQIGCYDSEKFEYKEICVIKLDCSDIFIENDLSAPVLWEKTFLIDDEVYFQFQLRDYGKTTAETLLNENGAVPVVLYYGDHSEKTRSEDEIHSLKKLSFELKPDSNSMVYVPFGAFFAERYLSGNPYFDFYIEIADKAGNVCRECFSYLPCDRYKFIYKDTSVEAIHSESKDSAVFCAKTILCLNDGSTINKRFIFSDELDKAGVKPGHYYRAYLQDCENIISYADESVGDCSAPVYFYSSEVSCEVKNVIEGAMFTVMSDKPVFVHTIWSPYNFGSNVEAWERFTVESQKLNEQVLTPLASANFMKNYDVDVSTVKEGMYYCTIVHFADNTTYISKVNKK